MEETRTYSEEDIQRMARDAFKSVPGFRGVVIDLEQRTYEMRFDETVPGFTLAQCTAGYKRFVELAQSEKYGHVRWYIRVGARE